MGNNDDIDVPLVQLYAASRTYFPDESDKVSKAAKSLYDVLETLNPIAARAGDPPLMQAMLEIGSEVCRMMTLGVTALDNGAEAVLITADVLRHTDAGARAIFSHLGAKTQGAYERLEDRAERHEMPRHAAPPLLPEHGQPGAIDTPGAPGTAGGPVTVPGSPDIVVPTRIGRGDLAPPPDLQTTPEPVDPDVDRREREATERRDRADNTTTLNRSGR